MGLDLSTESDWLHKTYLFMLIEWLVWKTRHVADAKVFTISILQEGGAGEEGAKSNDSGQTGQMEESN